MIINHNMNALNAHRNMTANTSSAGKAMEKLSSGLRINRAGDDAAGLAISEKMRGQIRGLDQASRNAQDGISLIQTAEGALNETHNILQRMRELAVQSANDTNITEDRAALQEEINALTQEIDRISEQTEFNKQTLLNGTFKGQFQIGANGGQTISLDIGNMASGELGLTTTSSVVESITTGTKTGNGAKINAGTYTIKANDILDKDGNIVGKVDANKNLQLGSIDGANYTKVVSSEDLKDGDKIIIGTDINDPNNVNKIDVKIETKRDLGDKGKELAAGKYEIKGTVVLRDGKEVGKLNGQDIDLEDGTKVKASDIGRNFAFADKAEFTINGADVSSSDKASGSIETITKAIENVSTQRAKLGAVQNRLEHTTANLNNTSENLTAAESRVRDVDMAKEMMIFSKNNILSQAAQAMLAQANQQPQGVLQLLR